MISFCIALAALIIGFFTYGKFVERVFGIDPDRKTPAIANPDGVDFVPLSGWKIFMIQFLNIAGLGPIFGAIMGLNSEHLRSFGLFSARFSLELFTTLWPE